WLKELMECVALGSKNSWKGVNEATLTGLTCMDKDVKAPPTLADVDDEDVSTEIFLGVVKSYNDRRGFGFLACTETADQFGRDVYMPKAEATMAALLATGIDRETAFTMVMTGNTAAAACSAALAAACHGPEASKAAAAACAASSKEEGEKSSAPRLAEEDLVFFRVRKSIEGYPQAVCVQRLHKLTGSVLHPPEEGGRPGTIKSEEATAVCGRREVFFDFEAAGQLRTIPGDLVSFCIPEAESKIGQESVRPSEPFARMVCLSSTTRPQGTVLGCFTLDLPRTRSDDLPGYRPNLRLPCHAFGDKLVLAGLPSDLDETELMKFFSKQGANNAIVAHARDRSFASVTFSSIVDVARFLSRIAHAYADEKGTLIARLLSKTTSMEEIPTLPALPAPTLSTRDADAELEAGSLMVLWSPLVLAVGYTVELRPVGSNSSWSSVDVTSKKLGAVSNRFDQSCSSCVVNSLQISTAYEARISYFTNCQTISEASDPSKPCLPSQGNQDPKGKVAKSVTPSGPSASNPEGYSSLLGTSGSLPLAKPPAPPAFTPGHLPPLHPPPHPHHPSLWSSWTPEVYPPDPGYTAQTWRSPTGLVVPPPAAPELCPADEYGFSLSVRWPAVLQAAAYVVELREAGTTVSERFQRTAPEAKLGTLVELRVGGLRPGPAPGRIYCAQVRTVGNDGWESLPSPWGWSVPLPPAEEPASNLSADAAPWQPGASLGGLQSKDEKWWPPPLLSTSQNNDQEVDFGASHWSGSAVPPPPVAPPTLGTGLALEENSTECLILD
ncbi:Uncharacterized protein SCF082_LOCUS33293, partial [Durusdinium trenchii]